MKRNQFITYISFVLFAVFLTQNFLVLTGCGNMIPPSGGPKDTLAPVLLKATPPDSTLGFNNKTITFSFDEYVELQDVQKNVIVSPNPGINPEFNYKLKTVTVKLNDSLKPNTTYSIDFGNSIQDINERNPLKNFTYIFSTGNHLDSLSFSGNVKLAETGLTDSTLIVMLHKSSDDSALINSKPDYITRLDGKGNFHFHFLPTGTFYVYALKDDNRIGKYFSKEQLFAFADYPVIISDSTPPLTLFAYATKNQEETNTAVQVPKAPAKNETPRLKYSTSVKSGQQDLLDSFSVKFATPLKSLDDKKIILSTDTSFTAVPNTTWYLDSSASILTYKGSLKPDTRYNLVTEKDFATDTLGLQLLKTDTLSFRTKRPEDYGSVRIRIKNFDPGSHPVLIISQNNKIVKMASLATAEFYQPLFLPGIYDLSILYDTNNNGKWDPGEFFGKHIQPEHVVPVKEKLSVKTGWDNEVEIEVSAAR